MGKEFCLCNLITGKADEHFRIIRCFLYHRTLGEIAFKFLIVLCQYPYQNKWHRLYDVLTMDRTAGE